MCQIVTKRDKMGIFEILNENETKTQIVFFSIQFEDQNVRGWNGDAEN